jgi:hypothetical protein
MKNEDKGVTVNDLENVQVIMRTKDGRMFYGFCKDEMTRNVICGTTRFIELDSDKVMPVNLGEYIKKQ